VLSPPIARVVARELGKERWPGHGPDIAGPHLWNPGAPNGLQRVDDILNAVKQYSTIARDDPSPLTLSLGRGGFVGGPPLQERRLRR